MNRDQNHQKIRWITTTAALIALLVALQWITSGTQAFAGQYITGSCVNAVLAIAALVGGLYSGIVVALLSPFCAFLLGIGPKFIQIVPGIAAGNLVFVLVLYFLIGRKKQPLWRREGEALVIAALLKFVTLGVLVNKLIVPLMADSLKPQQVAMFGAMFSWPQLVTALIGGTLALLMVPVLKKALKK